MFYSIRISLIVILLGCFAPAVFACEVCGCSLSRPEQQNHDERFFFQYVFEQQNWHKRDPHYAFDLGQDGHDTHDKTTEDFHHYLVGGRIGERILLTAEIPYIVRRALNVEDQDKLGNHMRSQGWGDFQTTGEFDLMKDANRTIGALAGVKFPTGSTEEKDIDGNLFEPEMQPGSGSYDYLWGGVYHQNWERLALSANAAYTLKTTGAADFRFGNSFLTNTVLSYAINPHSRWGVFKSGMQLIYLHEARQTSAGKKVGDSGGDTVSLGPLLNFELGKNVTVFTSLASPVYQNVGGVHQEQDYTWTLGSVVKW
jgi:hypothetical protein